jgi:hypothetical protein
MWQDIVIAVASIFLSYAIIPQILYGFKKKKKTVTCQTALITVIGVYAIAFSFFTLQLYFSAIMNSITGTLWLILFIQSVIYKD